jgi:fructose-1,6-bisphosphatase/inositol monophosphatase family enzyme
MHLLADLCETVPIILAKAAEIHISPPEEARLLPKGSKDYTHTVDLLVQAYLQEHLLALIPGSSFLGEEGEMVEGPKTRYEWVVDPTDGTAVYALGGEMYSISVALRDHVSRKTIFGCVYQPANGRYFVRGDEVQEFKKSFWSPQMHDYVVGIPRPSRSPCPGEWLICAFGTSFHIDKTPALQRQIDNIFAPQKIEGFDRSYAPQLVRPCSGSSALFLSQIANGERHGAVLGFQKAWDMSAGLLIARDVGCPVYVSKNLDVLLGDDEVEGTLLKCGK